MIAPEGTVTQARALLDSAASTSLISVGLATNLRLPCRPCKSKISGVADIGVHLRGIFTLG